MYNADDFFSIYLPNSGSSIGSNVSFASSNMTGFPNYMAFSRALLMILGSIVGLIETILNFSSIFLIQILAYI
jgi:hypothetical protein